MHPTELYAYDDTAISVNGCGCATLQSTPISAMGRTNDGVADASVDGVLLPLVLVATTVNVYWVPLVSPVTSHDVDAVVQVAPPGVAVTVYPVIDAPPSSAGAAHDTVT